MPLATKPIEKKEAAGQELNTKTTEQQLQNMQNLGDKISAGLAGKIPDADMAQLINNKIKFENPRSPDFGNPNTFYNRLMQIPSVANDLSVRKIVDGHFFEYSVNDQVITGNLNESRALQMIQDNWKRLDQVQNWTDYATYQKTANSMLSSVGSNFSFTPTVSLGSGGAGIVGRSLDISRNTEKMLTGTTLLSIRGDSAEGGGRKVGLGEQDEGISITGETKEERRGGAPEPAERAGTLNPFLTREAANVLAEDRERQENSVLEARARMRRER